MLNPQFCHDPINHPAEILFSTPIISRRKGNVVPYRGRKELIINILKQYAYPFADSIILLRRILAKYKDSAFIRREEAEDMVQKGRFPRAVSSEYHYPFSPVNYEI
jgi:hypothetical protein